MGFETRNLVFRADYRLFIVVVANPVYFVPYIFHVFAKNLLRQRNFLEQKGLCDFMFIVFWRPTNEISGKMDAGVISSKPLLFRSETHGISRYFCRLGVAVSVYFKLWKIVVSLYISWLGDCRKCLFCVGKSAISPYFSALSCNGQAR